MRIRQFFGAILLIALMGGTFSATAQSATPSITLQRVVVPAVYTPGQIIAITVTITKNDSRTLTALGLKDTVPDTWTLESYSAIDPSMRPPVGPAAGSNSMEFAYITVPSFPVTFTYRVKTGDSDSGQMSVSGYAFYRFTGAEEQSPVVNTPVVAAIPTEGESATEGETVAAGAGCTGCNQTAKDLGGILGDLFAGGLALATLLALSRQRG